jgi:hypothetical protein
MVNKYAVVIAGVVDNIVLWDGVTPWAPDKGSTLVLLADGVAVNIGWRWNGKSFTPPTV